VAVPAEGHRSAGRHTARFDGSNLPAGAYIARIESGTSVLTRMLQLLR